MKRYVLLENEKKKNKILTSFVLQDIERRSIQIDETMRKNAVDSPSLRMGVIEETDPENRAGAGAAQSDDDDDDE